MKNYGCDLVTTKDLKSVTLKVIKVNIRQNGMTSPGKELCCHPNVEYLVKNNRGQRLLGYMITQNPDDGEVQLLSHSVWITPEGKLADVTKRTSYLMKTNPSADKSIQFFIPVTTNGNIVIPTIVLSSGDRKLPDTWVEKITSTFKDKGEFQFKQNPTLKSLIHKVKSFRFYYSLSQDYLTKWEWFEGTSNILEQIEDVPIAV